MTERGREEGGASRPPAGPDDPTLVLHEEEARVGKRWEGVGHARVRREVERERVEGRYPRQVERLAQERVPVRDDDSGEIEELPDGSISIPIFEEELVVTRKPVLRERVIIRKQAVTDWQTVRTELRKERVRVDAGDAPEGAVEGAEPFAGPSSPAASFAETKPSFLTSEFAVLVLALLGLLITALASDAVDARFFWLVATPIVALYAISRGFAKAGSSAGDDR